MKIYDLTFQKVRFPFTGSIYQAEYESDQFRHFMARHPIHPSHAARPISREKFKARQAYEDNKKTESKRRETKFVSDYQKEKNERLRLRLSLQKDFFLSKNIARSRNRIVMFE